MVVDVGDHLLGQRSSSAPKTAAADLKDLVGPAQLAVLARQRLYPLALVAGQPRPQPIIGLGSTDPLGQVSNDLPNLWAIKVIAAHSTACSSWSSNTILPAHAPSSWGYLPGPVMAPTAHQSQHQ